MDMEGMFTSMENERQRDAIRAEKLTANHDFSKKPNPITVLRSCIVCENRYVIFLDRQDYFDWITQEKYVQDIWPHLSADDRELITSGTHPECWEKLWGEDK